ncbi:hypothetical protein PHYSODRAFT_523974, partial [Phytophthora sojae]
QPGGKIEEEELKNYHAGHVYAFQENGWMDRHLWVRYCKELLKFEVDAPSVLLLDNFDCHVSEEGQRMVADETGATVVSLPVNSTAVCQPLDVGVMGPLKKSLRALWPKEQSVEADEDKETAKEKRLALIKRTIAAWVLMSADTIIAAFEKAIPKFPTMKI